MEKDCILFFYLKNIVDFILYIDDVCFFDKILYGLFEIILMNFKLF